MPESLDHFGFINRVHAVRYMEKKKKLFHEAVVDNTFLIKDKHGTGVGKPPGKIWARYVFDDFRVGIFITLRQTSKSIRNGHGPLAKVYMMGSVFC